MGCAELADSGTAFSSLDVELERLQGISVFAAHNGRRLYPRDDIILPPIWNQLFFQHYNMDLCSWISVRECG